MSEVLEWRINIKVHTKDKPLIIDQPLNRFPMQIFPTSFAYNVGNTEEKQVIDDWHYITVEIYQKPRAE